MFLMKEVIAKKRDKKELSTKEINFFVRGVVDKTITNEQISSLAMAIYLNDLSSRERRDLTLAMRDSGDVIEFPDLNDKPIVDKHSTGGVGDLVSIPLAPIVAACGAYVPMITGKGLGHTGGTTDKMDSIPNYNTYPDVDTFKRVVKEVGCAIIGQTSSLAPADKTIYSIRDTTATVESIPLISSSILSKKLASGIKYLIMDVKTGNGAFMQNLDDSKDLATTIVNISNDCNVPTKALITDMNESLARNIGNSLEIKESIEFLKGNSKDKKLHDIIVSFASEMLLISGVEKDSTKATEKVLDALSSGKALKVFDNMVHALGGAKNFSEHYEELLPKSKMVVPIYHNESGYIKTINTKELGMCLVRLGGGRKAVNDILDLSVGLENVVKLGELVDSKNPIALLHCQNEAQVKELTAVLQEIFIVCANKDECPNIQNIYHTI